MYNVVAVKMITIRELSEEVLSFVFDGRWAPLIASGVVAFGVLCLVVWLYKKGE